MRAIIPIIGLLLVLTACQQAPTTPTTPTTSYTCPDGTVVDDVLDCPEIQEEIPDSEPTIPTNLTEPEEKIESPTDKVFGSDEVSTGRVAPELEQMQDRAEDKASDGYSYRLESIVDEGLYRQSIFAGATAWVKNGMIAVDFDAKSRLATGQEATYIVYDMNAQKGTKWCTMKKCEEIGEEVEFEGEILDHSSPMEWLYSLEETAYLGEKSLDNRKVMHVGGKREGENVELFVDTFSGLPLQVIIGEKIISYNLLGFGVKDAVFEGP